MLIRMDLTLFIPSNYRGINLSGPSNFHCWGKKNWRNKNYFYHHQILCVWMFVFFSHVLKQKGVQ